jgi:hypothetical protein
MQQIPRMRFGRANPCAGGVVRELDGVDRIVAPEVEDFLNFLLF